MIKKSLKISVILFLIFVSCLYPQTIKAEDSGYYYESIHVDVVVDEARTMRVTETLTVHFNEERHGIIRTIPTYSDVEDTWITDVEVSGAPYSVSDYSYETSIKIGDPDKYVTGTQIYTISYTLNFYEDYDESYDYIYLNLIGSQFDTRTEKLTASIKYPEDAELISNTVTEGVYGNRSNEKIEVEELDHEIRYTSKDVIEPYEAVTVQIQLNQGAFYLAPVKVLDYEILSKQVEINFDTKQNFTVVEKIQFQVNHDYSNYHIELPTVELSTYDYRIVDPKVTIDGIETTFYYYINLYKTGITDVEISYGVVLDKMIDGSMKVILSNALDEYVMDKVDLIVNIPNPRVSNVVFQRRGDSLDSSRYAISIAGSQLKFSSKTELNTFERASLMIELNKEDFSRPIHPLQVIMLILGFVSTGWVMFLKLFKIKKDPIINVVNFYPIENLNPLEVAYIVNRKVTNEDIGAMIFYWASLGSLNIEWHKKNPTLIRLGALPITCPDYESDLFESLFDYGDGTTVKVSQLKDNFYQDAQRARRTVHSYYKNDEKLDDPKINGLKYAIIFGLILFIVFSFIVINGVTNGTTDYNWIIGVILGCSLIAMIIAATLHKYTPRATYLLGQLLGFKQFIKTAEKDRLEALIEDDPQYYYHILPYAQVLNVTKVWEDKFKDITFETPDYVTGNYDDFSRVQMMRMMNNIIRDATYVTPSQSSGSSDSSFGGGSSGGGFSGGGFSGGGSGGGGSSSW